MCWEPTMVYPCGCPKKDPINHGILLCDKAKASDITCTGYELRKLYRDYTPEFWSPLTACDGDGHCPNQPEPFLKKGFEAIFHPLEVAHRTEDLKEHNAMFKEASRRNRDIYVERAFNSRSPEYQAMLQKLETTSIISPEEREASKVQADESDEVEFVEDESGENETLGEALCEYIMLIRQHDIRSGPSQEDLHRSAPETSSPQLPSIDDWWDDLFQDDEPEVEEAVNEALREFTMSLLGLERYPDPEVTYTLLPKTPLQRLPSIDECTNESKRSKSQKVFARIKDTISHFRERRSAKKNKTDCKPDSEPH